MTSDERPAECQDAWEHFAHCMRCDRERAAVTEGLDVEWAKRMASALYRGHDYTVTPENVLEAARLSAEQPNPGSTIAAAAAQPTDTEDSNAS